MTRQRTLLLLLGVASVGYAVARLLPHRRGHDASGGIMIGDAGLYDTASRFLLGSFYRGVANDVARGTPAPKSVLEIGCGPGHLSIELAAHGFDVTGLDLDPAMIERARANARRHHERRDVAPSFDVGDVASLPYPDDSFDLVVSTLSLHHWADPENALTEIARVLRPDGRAFVWDLGAGLLHRHGEVPDPVPHIHDSPLHLVEATPWRWPLRFTPTQRMELIHETAPSA
jgi:SAM-dependent methyltransferase